MKPHQHENDHFTIVLMGSYHEEIRGRRTEHRSGCMLFYPAGETHSQEFGDAGSSALIFRPKSAWNEILISEAIPLREAPFVDSGLGRSLAKRLLQETKRNDAFSELIVEGILLELIAAFSRAYRGTLRSEPHVWVRKCHEMLEANCGSALTHQELAGFVGRHPVHVARAFRQVYGETIGDFQRRQRLDRAATLLCKSSSSLAEIAIECGFANQAHFSRCFRAAFGVTPTRYRMDHC